MPRLRSILLLVLSSSFILLLLFFPGYQPIKATDKMASIQALKSLIVQPRSKHTATVIFVHVLGSILCSRMASLTISRRDWVTVVKGGNPSQVSVFTQYMPTHSYVLIYCPPDMFQKDSAMSHIKWVFPHAYVRALNSLAYGVAKFRVWQTGEASHGQHGHGNAYMVR